MNFKKVKENIIKWSGEGRVGSTDDAREEQIRLMGIMGKLSYGVLLHDRDKIKEAIGEMVINLIVLSKHTSVDIEEAIECEYNKIKEQRGVIISGVFIKIPEDK